MKILMGKPYLLSMVALAISTASLLAYAEGPVEAGHSSPSPSAEKPHEGSSKQETNAREENEEHGEVGADLVLGFGNLESPQGNRTTVYSFLLGGKYNLPSHFAVGLRWPFSIAPLPQGVDSNHVVSAGNLEMGPEYELELTSNIKLPFELGLALPTATGDEFSANTTTQQRALVNITAAQARGFEDNALFAPHRFGIVPKIGVHYERAAWDLAAYTKLELLVKAGGVQPSGEEKLRSLAVESVTGVSGFYDVIPELLALGARLWVSYPFAQEVDIPNSNTKKVQPVLEPAARTELGPVDIGVSYILPLGGPLGDASYGAFRFLLNAEFLYSNAILESLVLLAFFAPHRMLFL